LQISKQSYGKLKVTLPPQANARGSRVRSRKDLATPKTRSKYSATPQILQRKTASGNREKGNASSTDKLAMLMAN
jgi:formylmethanofuran dehydrogenase subunit E